MTFIRVKPSCKQVFTHKGGMAYNLILFKNATWMDHREKTKVSPKGQAVNLEEGHSVLPEGNCGNTNFSWQSCLKETMQNVVA